MNDSPKQPQSNLAKLLVAGAWDFAVVHKFLKAKIGVPSAQTARVETGRHFVSLTSKKTLILSQNLAV